LDIAPARKSVSRSLILRRAIVNEKTVFLKEDVAQLHCYRVSLMEEKKRHEEL
jgi:hypothetical protein